MSLREVAETLLLLGFNDFYGNNYPESSIADYQLIRQLRIEDVIVTPHDWLHCSKKMIAEVNDADTGFAVELTVKGKDFLKIKNSEKDGINSGSIKPDRIKMTIALLSLGYSNFNANLAEVEHKLTATTTREDIISWIEEIYDKGLEYLEKLQIQLSLAKMLKV
jgi:hypothetical protein